MKSKNTVRPLSASPSTGSRRPSALHALRELTHAEIDTVQASWVDQGQPAEGAQVAAYWRDRVSSASLLETVEILTHLRARRCSWELEQIVQEAR